MDSLVDLQDNHAISGATITIEPIPHTNIKTDDMFDGMTIAPQHQLTHLQRMKLQDGFFGITIVILFLMILRYVYINHFNLNTLEDEYRYDHEKDNVNNTNPINNSNNTILKDIDLNELIPIDKTINYVPDKHNKLAGHLKQFELGFSINYPNKLMSASKSFMEYAKVDNFAKLRKKYHINSNIRRLYNSNPNNLTISEVTALKEKNKHEENFDEEVTLTDLFIFDTKFFNTALSLSSHYKESQLDGEIIIINNEVMLLKTSIISANVEILTDVIYSKDKDQILFRFSIISLTNKIDPLVNNISTIRYKELLFNLVVNTTFPVILINRNGISFMNKCACDWLNINYSRVEDIYDVTASNGLLSINEVFGKISNDVVKLLEGQFEGKTVDFYNKYIFDNRDIYMHCSHFYNNREDIELIVSLYNASEMVINNGNTDYESLNSPSICNQYDNVINSNKISYVRYDISSNTILKTNANFDIYKETYTNMLNTLVNLFNKDQKSYTIDFYTYRLIFYYIYSNNDTIIDTFIIRAPSHHISEPLAIKTLIYEYSDLPVVIIDKKLNIIHKNTNFKRFLSNFNDNNSIESINDIVDKKDINKIKRGVSDAIKFKCKDLEDKITFVNKNKEERIIDVIKNYIDNNGEPLLSLSLL